MGVQFYCKNNFCLLKLGWGEGITNFCNFSPILKLIITSKKYFYAPRVGFLTFIFMAFFKVLIFF